METESKPKRPRGSGGIWRVGKYYWLQYYDGSGRKIRMSSKSEDPNVAEKMLRKKIGMVEAGIDPDHRGLRYDDVRVSYLRERMARKNKALPRRRDGSLILGDDGLPVFSPVTRLDSFFKGVKVRTIGTDEINEFISEQRKLEYEPATVNRSLTCLRAMLRLAQQDGKLHRVPRFPMLRENNTRTGYFEYGDYRKLLAVLPDHLKAVLAIGFWTGVRIGEIKSLRWSQIDFFDNVIRLRPGETKNNEARTVPMSAELLAIMRAHRSACPKGFEWVCYQPGEQGSVERLTTFVRTWRKCCKEVSLEGRLFHDLRRSAVRSLVRAGVPEAVAMRISGHKTRSIFTRYNIIDEKDLSEAGRKLENYIREIGAKTVQNEEPAEAKPQLTN